MVLVCDGRRNGEVLFYIDGQPAGKKRLSIQLPLDLNAFRIGAYDGWQNDPSNNFHDEIPDVRVCGGMLTDKDVAHLFLSAK